MTEMRSVIENDHYYGPNRNRYIKFVVHYSTVISELCYISNFFKSVQLQEFVSKHRQWQNHHRQYQHMRLDYPTN